MRFICGLFPPTSRYTDEAFRKARLLEPQSLEVARPARGVGTRKAQCVMPDPIDKNISFRSLMRGEVDDFVRDEGLACSATAASIVAVASRLATLREEGTPLWPEVYFCTSIERLTTVLQGTEVIELGSGPHEESTVLRGLKVCAPLATAGWVIFIQRETDRFKYGIFTAINLPLSITPYEALVENPTNNLAIVVRRLAENCVEVKGGRGHRRCLFFSDARAEAPSPVREIEQFCRALTRDVELERQDDVRRYFYRMLSDLLLQGHGALLVVQSHRRKKLPKNLGDSIVLPEPISVAGRVREYKEHKDDEALEKLVRASALLKGMLGSDSIVVFRSDGSIIVVFRSDGSIIAYRAFLTPKRRSKSAGAGGARRRTFEALRDRIGSDFEAVLICSQDGTIEFSGI